MIYIGNRQGLAKDLLHLCFLVVEVRKALYMCLLRSARGNGGKAMSLTKRPASILEPSWPRIKLDRHSM